MKAIAGFTLKGIHSTDRSTKRWPVATGDERCYITVAVLGQAGQLASALPK